MLQPSALLTGLTTAIAAASTFALRRTSQGSENDHRKCGVHGEVPPTSARGALWFRLGKYRLDG